MKKCKVDECRNTNIVGWGWCRAHYKRWKRGSSMIITAHMSPLEKLLMRVKVVGECWEVQGFLNCGYPVVVVEPGGPQVRANRFVYELFFGPIPEGLFACHHCDNKACIRPDHLYAGTPKENVRDAIDRGLYKFPKIRRGEENHAAILNADTVREIRRRLASGESNGSVARAMTISAGAVSMINSRKRWAHVT